jgi:flagellar protein FlbD
MFPPLVNISGRLEKERMIRLTRLNRQPFVVNSDLIEVIENAPDTVITLITGHKLVVLESVEHILEQIIRFRRRLLPTSLAVIPPVAVLPHKDNGDSTE